MDQEKHKPDEKSERSNWGEMPSDNGQTKGRYHSHSFPKGKVLMEFSEITPNDVIIPEFPPTSKEEENSANDSSDPEDETLQGASLLTRNKMLSHISRSNMPLFFKSQQRGDPKLSRKEKKEIAATLLESNPSLFLSRYGKCLTTDHLLYFHQFKESYEVQFHLQQLEKSSASKAKLIKNRRYQAMQELISQGEYFSMSEMRSRNPLLFQHLVERHMTAEEREEVQPAQDATCDLSTVLMAHINRDEQHRSVRRQEQEAEQMAWNEDEPSEEDNSDAESELDDDEKELLKQEFISNMHNSFLEGRDKDFDYSTVDENQRYDDLLLSERDAEERYFDSD